MLGKGEVTLVGGKATVPLKRIPADAVVILSRKSALGATGLLDWSISPGDSFSITSLNVLDASVVRWIAFT